MNCPECRRPISDKAPACPHCGKPVTEADRARAAEAAAKNRKFVKWGCLTLLVLLVLFVALAYMLEPGGTDDLSRAFADNSSMATIQCENFVRDRLRSPSTADFPFGGANVASLGSNTFVVRSYVDSQNGFGAMIRSQFSCRIRFRGGDGADQRNWELIDLQMN